MSILVHVLGHFQSITLPRENSEGQYRIRNMAWSSIFTWTHSKVSLETLFPIEDFVKDSSDDLNIYNVQNVHS